MMDTEDTISQAYRPVSAAVTARDELATQVALATTAVSALASIAFLVALFSLPIWQLVALSGVFALSWTVSGLATANVWSLDPVRRILSSTITLMLAFALTSALVEGVGFSLAAIVLIYALMVSAAGLTSRQSDVGATVGLIAALVTAFLNAFPIFPKVSFPALQVFTPVLLVLLVISYAVLVWMKVITVNLRVKFITGALAIAIIPLAVLSIIEARFIQTALQDQTNQALQLAAEQTATRLDEFLRSNLIAIEREASIPAVENYLNMDPQRRPGSKEEQELIRVIDSLMSKPMAYLYSYALLNMQGDVVYDNSGAKIKANERSLLYFDQTISSGQSTISPIQFSKNGDAYVYFSAPVRNDQQQMIGVIRLRYNALALQYLVEDYRNLIGPRSYPLLLDDNYLRIADTLAPRSLYQPVVPVDENQRSILERNRRLPAQQPQKAAGQLPVFAASLADVDNTPFFTAAVHPDNPDILQSGAIVRLSNQPWYVVFVQDRTTLDRVLREQTSLSTLIATLIAGAVGLIATFLSRFLSNPILALQDTAEKIAAGSLEAQARVDSNDEIGALAQAFNVMTERLKTFINELEDRVIERTRELDEQNKALLVRSNQLNTIAAVARDVASAQELEKLLSNVTNLISERFGFYHVGIFLIDERGEYAVLRAANSVGGQRMLARGHRLRVGQVGIVGYVTGTGEARIATDVGQDAVFFDNPDLPETSSEMALPLKVAGRIIGALDVQSTESNAFTQDDIDLFSTLADQIAIAIQNNRLLDETRQALEEAQRIHRRYLQQEWTREIEEYPRQAYRYTELGLSAGADGVQDETDAAEVHDVPIVLRGETIGVIRVQGTENSDELETVRAVADQVALALENARLFEQTVRRADRERKVLEITSKIRSTSDPQYMLRVALEELKQALQVEQAQIVLQPAVPENDESSTEGNGRQPGSGNHRKPILPNERDS